MRRRTILLILMILLIIVTFGIICIRPVEKFSDDSVEKVSLTDLLGEKLMDSAMDMLSNSSRELQFELSETDINNMIASNMKQSTNEKVDGIHSVIHNGEIICYVDMKLLSLIPTQLILKTKMDVVDNEIKININKVYLGRVPISKKSILKTIQKTMQDKTENKIENIKIDLTNSIISIPISLPEAVSIKDIEVMDSIKFKLNISIQSISDLLELFKFFEKD